MPAFATATLGKRVGDAEITGYDEKFDWITQRRHPGFLVGEQWFPAMPSGYNNWHARPRVK